MKTFILGRGWLGQQWLKKNPQDQGSQRDPQNQTIVPFDLFKRATWSHLIEPLNSHPQMIWTFSPAQNEEDLHLLKDFCRFLKSFWHGQLILWSTTSLWQNEGISTEFSPFTPTIRSKAEDLLNQQLRAITLHLGGLFGSQRSPLTWLLNKGFYQSKRIHLIHADDILSITRHFFSLWPSIKHQSRWILMPPHAQSWDEHVYSYQRLGLLEASFPSQPYQGFNRIVRSAKLYELALTTQWKRPGFDENRQELLQIRQHFNAQAKQTSTTPSDTHFNSKN